MGIFESITHMTSTQLIFAAVIGIALILFMIIRLKMHAMLAILVGAVITGLLAGMSFSQIVSSVNDGVGNTLKGIALLVGLGSMFGSILEISGGARSVANCIIGRFGEKKAAWALGFTGLLIAIPVFFDAGLIILIPLAFSFARRSGRSVLAYSTPLLAGLAVGHAFIPPTPGPVLVASMLGVELGWVIIIGSICGILALIVAGPLWGSCCAKKYFIPVPDFVADSDDGRASKLPSAWVVFAIIMLPLLLIILKSLASVLQYGDMTKDIMNFLGEPFVALTLSTLLAMYLLGRRNGYTREELEKVMTKSLEPTGLILLVTACGGILRYVLQNSGLGEVTSSLVASSSLPIVVVAFLIAAFVRISVGSATVSMTMAAGLVAAMPEIATLPPLQLACITAAIAGGATVCSHFNDSGFWLVKSLLRIDEKTTLKTWTVMETIVGLTGFAVALFISLVA